MKKVDIISNIVARKGEALATPSKGISKVNLSDYLLKSIWDKVWEIRTDSQGTEYIFGKLPVVTKYGITMYSGDGVDIPSLASGLPFDGRTIWYNPETNQIEVIGGTGGGSGEGVSNFWDLSGIPSWITKSKPKYTYSEIEGTPDLTKYALVSQIPSLFGYATESWVNQQNYAIKATTLSGYGITDAYTKTNVDDLLKSYVTLGGTQTITGEKNFTGGLKVNGSPIYYDTEKKYWKLEGDLLVTGGVTMYGSDSSFTPSTIMDAILYDDATLGINSNGQLYVKGGTSGGGLDITALQNYLTQNSYLNVTSGDNRYLKLSGGTLSSNSRSPLTLKSGSSENHSLLLFNRGSDYWGSIGFNAANSLIFKDTNGASYTIWHSGNDGSGSGLDADTLDGLHNGELKASILHSGGGFVVDANTMQFSDFSLRFYSGIPNTSTNLPTSSGYQNGLLVLPLHSNGSTAQIYLAVGKNPYFRSHHTYEWNEIAYKTDNVSSATKLQTARTIWGQSFDGSGDVSGNLTLGYNKLYIGNGTDNFFIGWGADNYYVYQNYYGHYFTTKGERRMTIDGSGNVGIGTASPAYKLHVAGSGYFESCLSIGTASTASLSMNRTSANYIITPTSGYMVFCMGGNGTSVNSSNLVLYTHDVAMAMSGGNVGIGTASPSYKLDVNGAISTSTELIVNGGKIKYDSTKKYWKLEGDLLVTGGVTMYGNEGTFTPSTIMDAIAVDGTTISKSGGVLKVIGGTGGGVADSVAWANITGKPTWIGSSKPSYSYSEITGAISTTELQNYLTQNSYLNVTSGDNRYLKLSGGTLSSNSRSPLTLKSGSSENHSLLLFNRGSDYWGSIGFNAANSLIFKDTNGASYTIWHSGNDGSGSGLDADTLDGLHNGELKASILHSGGGSVIDANTMQFSDFSLRFYSGIPNTSTNLPTSSGYQNGLLVLPLHSNGSTAQIYLAVGKNPYFRSHHTYEWNEIAYKTDNVSSATKLQTARTIWGQSFDGSGDVSGNLTLGYNKLYIGNGKDNFFIGWGADNYYVYQNYYGHYFTTNGERRMTIDGSGNVGIGTASPSYKLDVNGAISTSTELIVNGGKIKYDSTKKYWKLEGDLLVTGGVTMYSDQRKKTILNHVELSLKQIANAPLIEHYYNGDEKKTTHVGSIAQYWANMNDWFCKLDSEGYYTMEIQNAALASAISIARELDRYENKTDKAIKKLKKRICELEEEVERLKAS